MAWAACILACSPPSPAPQPPPPDLGYVEWIAQRPWAAGDLPAVAASFDELCRRAEAGDERARDLVPGAGTALWLARTILLPVLRVLPNADDVPADERLATACPARPDQHLAAVVEEFASGVDREHAVERLLAAEYQGGPAGTSDDARLARIVLAVTLLFPLDALQPTPALVAAVNTLDPDDELLVPASTAGGQCMEAPDDPACLWERLAVQALTDSTGSEVVDRSALTPEAIGTFARRGLLDLVARVSLPVVEDPSSTVRLLAAQLLAGFAQALGIGEPVGVDQVPGDGEESAGEGSFPEPTP